MATAIINGRKVDLPNSTTDQKIRELGDIGHGRTLLRRNREGNWLVPVGTTVQVDDGDRFIDAPARVKGGEQRR
jgi:hypothetical protein